MTSAPDIWPFDGRAFLVDTEKLSAAERGAYICLLIFYWFNGGLPADDDAQLRRIAGLSGPAWQRSRPRLAKLFRAGWRHGRVDFELAAVRRFSAEQSARAKMRWRNANLMNATRTARPVDNVDSALTHESCGGIGPPEQNQPLNAAASHAVAMPNKKMNIDSSFGARGNQGSVDKSENGRQARGLPKKQNDTAETPPRRRARQVWENGVRAWTDRNGIDYAHAIDMLGGDPDLCERITTAEVVKPGSGLQTALWALSEMIVGRQ